MLFKCTYTYNTNIKSKTMQWLPIGRRNTELREGWRKHLTPEIFSFLAQVMGLWFFLITYFLGCLYHFIHNFLYAIHCMTKFFKLHRPHFYHDGIAKYETKQNKQRKLREIKSSLNLHKRGIQNWKDRQGVAYW
jgi:hypothetical protein